MTIIRIEAYDGATVDGNEKRSLELVLNDLELEGYSLLSHQIAFYEEENGLIEVVLMQRKEP